TKWLWNFGDGSSSVIANPTHLYDSAGVYDISLIVEDALGCKDTMFVPAAVIAKGPTANFSVGFDAQCTSTTLNLYDSSLNAVQWIWDYGDGESDSIQNAQHTYQVAGQYNVSLTVYDTAGCVSSFSQSVQISVLKNVEAKAYRSDSIGCAPFQVQFRDSSTNADGLIWDFGNGVSSNTSDTTIIYTQPGTYYVTLIALSDSGCHDTTTFSTPIIVNFQPQADFVGDPLEGCIPMDVQFTDLSIADTSTNYYWQSGSNTSTNTDPLFTYGLQGVYDVTLILENRGMCFDTLTKVAYVIVNDSTAPPESPIYSVDVKANDKIEVTWQNSASIDLGAYILLRFNAVTLRYDTVFVDNNPNNISFSLTSSYTDSTVNTLDSIYTYKLSTTDKCGYSLRLRELTAHSSINVEAVALGPNIAVSWNPYGGCNVSGYEMYRKAENETLWNYIRTFDRTTLNYLDTSLTCPIMYYYRIVAKDLCGRLVSANSDTAGARPVIPMPTYELEIVRSTVINNAQVYTEWRIDSLLVPELKGFELFRSTNGSTFHPIKVVPSFQSSYIDNNVDVHNNRYQYMVRALNKCDIAGLMSKRSSSILLKAETADGKVRLRWTPYEKWDTGVKVYVIEQKNRYGVWERVKIVNGNVLEYFD
ncbi:MAG: PKD domain-containing protein, partial [Bacteroidia bacterium]|nr:PKD domain-containing protein [Bacteroidia bacterium]